MKGAERETFLFRGKSKKEVFKNKGVGLPLTFLLFFECFCLVFNVSFLKKGLKEAENAFLLC
jgi:hypothetical protein